MTKQIFGYTPAAKSDEDTYHKYLQVFDTRSGFTVTVRDGSGAIHSIVIDDAAAVDLYRAIKKALNG